MDWTWLPPTIVAALAVAQAWRANRAAHAARNDVQKLHLEVNSRLTQLLRAATEGAHAAGRANGIENERLRQEGHEREGDP